MTVLTVVTLKAVTVTLNVTVFLHVSTYDFALEVTFETVKVKVTVTVTVVDCGLTSDQDL